MIVPAVKKKRATKLVDEDEKVEVKFFASKKKKPKKVRREDAVEENPFNRLRP